MQTRRKFLSSSTLTLGALSFLGMNAVENLNSTLSRLPKNLSPQDLSNDEEFWGRIQSAFEIDRSIINLNNGGLSPSPAVVHNALITNLDYQNRLPVVNMWRHLEPNVENVRQRIAQRFACDKEEIAITRNASESLQIVQSGLDLKEGDEVLTTNHDYPRMRTTWDQLSRRNGIKVKVVELETPVNDSDVLEKIENGITERTKVILICHILFTTGQILPVKEISKLAHDNGIEVICDGAHSFSHFPFTLADLDCDYFGCSLHKWTYAPVGTGFLYVKKEHIKKLWPLMAAPENMDENIRKFEEIGTHPAANHNAIAEAISFNEGLGIDRKAARLRYLNKIWIDKIKDYNRVKFYTDIKNNKKRCGITLVGFEDINIGKLVGYLFNKHRIVVTNILMDDIKGIRVTPNVYTLESEVKYFASVLEKVIEGKVEEVLEEK